MILGSGLIQASGPSFGTVTADSSDSALFSGYTPNVATVGPVSRRLYFGKTGGAWKTLWTDTTGALLRGDELGTYAVTKASDGPVPFDTDDGLATDTHSGSVAAGTTFTHESDFLLEFTVTTLPTAVNGIKVFFRYQDASNYWMWYLNNSNTLFLYENVGGSFSSRGSVSSAVSPGDRAVIIADGQNIKFYVANTLKISYASAANFATKTAGELNAVTGGTVSNVKTWPRTLSGTAASILNKVSA